MSFIVYVHCFGYRKIKYLDDGRDYVSVKEFFSVHVTFSVLNSWVTYFAIFNLFVYLKIQFFNKHEINITEATMTTIAMVLMMFETTIHLAYYKDIIFAIITLLNYIGMYLSNIEKYDPTRRDPELIEVLKLQKAFMSLTAVFIAVTLLHDFDKVFYL